MLSEEGAPASNGFAISTRDIRPPMPHIGIELLVLKRPGGLRLVEAGR